MERKLACGHYYGEVVQRRQAAGLILTETRYAPGVRLPRHSHEHAYFCLVRRGTYTEAYGTQSRACGPLTVAFHPPEEVHSEHFDNAEVWSFNIEVTPGWHERLRGQATVLDRPADFRGGTLAGLALRLHHEFRHMDDFSPLIIEGLTLEILAEVARTGTPHLGPRPPRWLERIREMLHTHFAESVSLAWLAEAAGVHPVSVASAFRRFYRCTVGQYLRRCRVDFACRRLTTSGDSLAEIALAAGFADQSHFCRTFKRHTGLTPAAYRQMARH
jgi:AraC family transcriptional regulator